MTRIELAGDCDGNAALHLGASPAICRSDGTRTRITTPYLLGKRASLQNPLEPCPVHPQTRHTLAGSPYPSITLKGFPSSRRSVNLPIDHVNRFSWCVPIFATDREIEASKTQARRAFMRRCFGRSPNSRWESLATLFPESSKQCHRWELNPHAHYGAPDSESGVSAVSPRWQSVGTAGFEPAISCPPDRRFCQAKLHPVVPTSQPTFPHETG